MSRFTTKQAEFSGRAVVNNLTGEQKAKSSSLQLEASPNAAVAQKMPHIVANNSEQVNQMRSLQGMVNASPQVKQLKALQMMVNKSAAPVQRYTYQKGATQSVTLKGQKSNKTATFDVCNSNKVSYNKGDQLQNGSGTGNADWKGWLIDGGTKNNATQLHVVNENWGGLGGAKDGNIAPGSQAQNGKHKVPEFLFKKLFDNNNKAKYDMTYTAMFDNSEVLKYNGSTITNDVNIVDPTISCYIDADNKINEKWGEGWGVLGAHGAGMIIHDGS